jgi:class 3 adenylate cyclase/tetratricopeptide (TPR) repeat protein
VARRHPGVAAYDALPELEKEQYRSAVRAAASVLLHPAAGTGQTSGPLPTRVPDAVRAPERTNVLLPPLETMDRNGCLALWRSISAEGEDRRASLELYQRLAFRLLKLGELVPAYDVLVLSLKSWPQDVRLRQLYAMALLRSGAYERARKILEQLDTEQPGAPDEETLGQIARTYKDAALLEADLAKRQALLREAAEKYLDAYQKTGGIWTGINAATLFRLVDDAQAQPLAVKVHAQCLAELAKMSPDDDPYWTLATLGEASLVLENWAGARTWYGSASRVGRGRYGDLASTRRNAHLLLEHLEGRGEDLQQLIRLPRVAVFAGHMIDRPGRPQPRFPAQLERFVYDEIRKRLVEQDVRVGFSSAACGGDILFLEALQDLGGEAHVVLPYNQEEFVQHSVALEEGSTWPLRFRVALQRAVDVSMAAERPLKLGSISYDYANWQLSGMASMRSEQLSSEMVGIAVWDGQPGDGAGGTSTVVERWEKLGVRVEVIDIRDLLRQHAPHLVSEAPAAAPARVIAATARNTDIMAMLFADAVGYSKLSDEQAPHFVREVLGLVSEVLKQSQVPPEVQNTWGDGLYFVFKDLRQAGLVALELSDRIRSAEWENLPKDMSLRVALHAGPVHRCEDPIINGPNYTGAHVSYAARIEPITPPGLVYASQAFAAIAAARGVKEFLCDYVGQLPFAKNFGVFPLYQVRRRSVTSDR